MANQILSSIFAVVFLMIAVSMAVFLFLYWLWKYGKRKLAEDKENEEEYQRHYIGCAFDIGSLEINSVNYDFIMHELQKLGQLKFKDKERTCMLTMGFLIKFKTEVDKRLTA